MSYRVKATFFSTCKAGKPSTTPRTVFSNSISIWFLHEMERTTWVCRGGDVRTLGTENLKLSVLTGTDPQENTAFNLRPWKRLPRLNYRTGIMGVWFE